MRSSGGSNRMATAPRTPADAQVISYKQAIEQLSRDERFKATVYAMNSLLVQKGVYSPDEFEFQVRQWAQKELRKRTR